MGNKPSQKTIRIDANLFDKLDQWLKSHEAQSFGYHSKAQFVTEAVREKLIQDYENIKKIPNLDETTIVELRNGKIGKIEKIISDDGKFFKVRLKNGVEGTVKEFFNKQIMIEEFKPRRNRFRKN